jgi:chromosome segregation ATPase
MEYEERHEELEHETEKLEEQAERIDEHIDEARSDWESKKKDSGVPGAQAPDEDETGPPPEAEEPPA